MQQYAARLFAVVLALSTVLPGTGEVASAQGYNVVVNGGSVWNSQAEMHDGQLMVSVRPFMEALGGSVAWSPADRRATVQANGSQVAFWVNSNTAYHNGERLWAPVTTYIKNDKTMVPAWWLAVRLGARVSFSGGTLKVQTANPAPAPMASTFVAQQSHPLMNRRFVFPFPAGARYETYYDGWGDPRSFAGQNTRHEGTDILARTGTPLVAAASGTVVRYGWNTLGGYRLTIQLDDYPEYRFYYAHFDRYAPNMYLGAKVKAGQLLGYVGSSGQGPERTDGQFVPHLHFGIYGPNGAINPYKFLKFWESNKVGL